MKWFLQLIELSRLRTVALRTRRRGSLLYVFATPLPSAHNKNVCMHLWSLANEAKNLPICIEKTRKVFHRVTGSRTRHQKSSLGQWRQWQQWRTYLVVVGNTQEISQGWLDGSWHVHAWGGLKCTLSLFQLAKHSPSIVVIRDPLWSYSTWTQVTINYLFFSLRCSCISYCLVTI